jgi:hypothetical protein
MNPTPDPAEPKVEKSKGRTLEWLMQNPLTGYVLAVVSIAVSIYFGVVSIRSRELSYEISPTKTLIVKSGQSSDLHVLYKGQDVPTDVSALQVAIWNAGRESIRPENILTPITLTTSPVVPILEARIKKATRNVSQIGLDTSEIAKGSVGLTWKILEHDDGAVLQLIVAGASTVTVQAEGIVEGQGTPVAVRSDGNSPKDMVIGTLTVGFIAGLFYFANAIQRRVERRFGWGNDRWTVLVLVSVFVILFAETLNILDILGHVPPALR